MAMEANCRMYFWMRESIVCWSASSFAPCDRLVISWEMVTHAYPSHAPRHLTVL